MITDITTLIATIAAILFYLGAAGYIIRAVRHQETISTAKMAALGLCPIGLHGFSLQQTLFIEGGVQLGLLTSVSLIALVVNLVVLISGLKKPLHELFIVQFPFSALILLITLLSGPSEVVYRDMQSTTIVHILLSVLAYSLLIIATLHVLVLAYQNHQLRHHHLTGVVRLLPPLQTMESLLFELLWVGEILLTLAIATGFLFLDDLFAQQLAHKTVFSIIAWCIYAILLWGRHTRGWRGNTALRWTLGGFCALMLAYFGSKFVLEILL
ncbi:MAG: inner membrane protein YpjD [Candidatus Pelagadaptatus aseana]